MTKRPRLDRFWLAALIALAGAAAYANSLAGPFLFDDQGSVVANRSIRHLATSFWPDHGQGQTVEERPVLNLTLALNYAAGGLGVRGYHLVNVAIHLLAGLALFGLVRRTLLLPSLAPRFGRDAGWLAASAALLWTLHPLQTQAVTYVIQRAESLMGLFFLFMFYAFVRSVDGGRPGPWRGLCVASFLLGIGTKEAIVSALPLLALYDSIFVSGGPARAWRAHRGLWLALGGCLAALVALVAAGGGNRSGSIGLGIGGAPWAHALTQPQAVLTYLKLSFLPRPLIFDYGTMAAPIDGGWWLQAAAVTALIALAAVALGRAPAAGFLGAWFFLILAPTALAPGATQFIVEYRMYLPLAAVAVAFVLGLHRLLGRRSLPLLLALAAGCGWLTARRNETYRTEETLWSDNVAKRPDAARGRYGLGNALAAQGRAAEAAAQFEAALRLQPDYPEARNGLGLALEAMPDRLDEAIAQYREALRLHPNYSGARNNLGVALGRCGRDDEALAEFQRAVAADPDFAQAHFNLGIALRRAGRTDEAIAQYREALRLNPDVAEVHNNLGIALARSGRVAESVGEYEAALRLAPADPSIHYNLAASLVQLPGRGAEAVAQLNEVLRLQPDNEPAREALDRIRIFGP